MAEHSFLADAAIYLVATVVFVPVAARFGLGSVIGYLLAGCAIGPFGLGLFSLYWLGAWPLWAFGAGAAFGSVFALSSLAAYAAGHQRINAV